MRFVVNYSTHVLVFCIIIISCRRGNVGKGNGAVLRPTTLFTRCMVGQLQAQRAGRLGESMSAGLDAKGKTKGRVNTTMSRCQLCSMSAMGRVLKREGGGQSAWGLRVMRLCFRAGFECDSVNASRCSGSVSARATSGLCASRSVQTVFHTCLLPIVSRCECV